MKVRKKVRKKKTFTVHNLITINYSPSVVQMLSILCTSGRKGHEKTILHHKHELEGSGLKVFPL